MHPFVRRVLEVIEGAPLSEEERARAARIEAAEAVARIRRAAARRTQLTLEPPQPEAAAPPVRAPARHEPVATRYPGVLRPARPVRARPRPGQLVLGPQRAGARR